MDSTDKLKQSHFRLYKLAGDVENYRREIINHPHNNPYIAGNSTYFPYLSLVEKYTGFEYIRL